MAYLHPFLEQFSEHLQRVHSGQERLTEEDKKHFVALLAFFVAFQPPQPFQFPPGIVDFHPTLKGTSTDCIRLIQHISLQWNCIQYGVKLM